MGIPDCYDPACQEDSRQRRWDEHLAKLPDCAICGRKIMDGEDVCEAHGKRVCGDCMDDLTENIGIVEVE